MSSSSAFSSSSSTKSHHSSSSSNELYSSTHSWNFSSISSVNISSSLQSQSSLSSLSSKYHISDSSASDSSPTSSTFSQSSSSQSSYISSSSTFEIEVIKVVPNTPIPTGSETADPRVAGSSTNADTNGPVPNPHAPGDDSPTATWTVQGTAPFKAPFTLLSTAQESNKLVTVSSNPTNSTVTAQASNSIPWEGLHDLDYRILGGDSHTPPLKGKSAKDTISVAENNMYAITNVLFRNSGTWSNSLTENISIAVNNGITDQAGELSLTETQVLGLSTSFNTLLASTNWELIAKTAFLETMKEMPDKINFSQQISYNADVTLKFHKTFSTYWSADAGAGMGLVGTGVSTSSLIPSGTATVKWTDRSGVMTLFLTVQYTNSVPLIGSSVTQKGVGVGILGIQFRKRKKKDN